jgi:SOS-response transcriptional repressor LexA
MEKRPTKKQKELLNFIDGFIKGNGYGPSYREIMRALDYKSVSTVATHVDGLIQRGWLRKRDNEARTLEVVAPGDEPTPAVVIGATSGVEKELRAKLTELQESPEENAEDITTLSRTLVILGYEPKTEIA